MHETRDRCSKPFDELLQLAEAIVPQHPGVFGVEQAERLLTHRWRAISAARKCTRRLPSLRRYNSEMKAW